MRWTHSESRLVSKHSLSDQLSWREWQRTEHPPLLLYVYVRIIYNINILRIHDYMYLYTHIMYVLLYFGVAGMLWSKPDCTRQ